MDLDPDGVEALRKIRGAPLDVEDVAFDVEDDLALRRLPVAPCDGRGVVGGGSRRSCIRERGHDAVKRGAFGRRDGRDRHRERGGDHRQVASSKGDRVVG